MKKNTTKNINYKDMILSLCLKELGISNLDMYNIRFGSRYDYLDKIILAILCYKKSGLENKELNSLVKKFEEKHGEVLISQYEDKFKSQYRRLEDLEIVFCNQQKGYGWDSVNFSDINGKIR